MEQRPRGCAHRRVGAQRQRCAGAHRPARRRAVQRASPRRARRHLVRLAQRELGRGPGRSHPRDAPGFGAPRNASDPAQPDHQQPSTAVAGLRGRLVPPDRDAWLLPGSVDHPRGHPGPALDTRGPAAGLGPGGRTPAATRVPRPRRSRSRPDRSGQRAAPADIQPRHAPARRLMVSRPTPQTLAVPVALVAGTTAWLVPVRAAEPGPAPATTAWLAAALLALLLAAVLVPRARRVSGSTIFEGALVALAGAVPTGIAAALVVGPAGRALPLELARELAL